MLMFFLLLIMPMLMSDLGYLAESGTSSNLSGKLDLQFVIFTSADE